jgi:myo-inositol-1(or 4)-monophosphatase
MRSLKKVDWPVVLVRAARAGKRAIIRNYDWESRNRIMKRGVGGDQTLKIDEASETAIFNSLKQDLGKDSFVFLSEELGQVGRSSRAPIVVCDPLDGSHNAQVGIPLFSVALSVMGLRQPVGSESGKFSDVDAAAIVSVKTPDEYFALKGKSAFLNGKKIEARRRQQRRINTLLIETGDMDFLKTKLIRRLDKRLVYKTRILGSAALSLCYLADGSADALIFAQPGGARTIDSPAGYLIAREAGCVFADASGRFRDVGEIEVGFHSRLNLLAARDRKTLSKLQQLVRTS